MVGCHPGVCQIAIPTYRSGCHPERRQFEPEAIELTVPRDLLFLRAAINPQGASNLRNNPQLTAKILVRKMLYGKRDFSDAKSALYQGRTLVVLTDSLPC
jgi:hypothetical protein